MLTAIGAFFFRHRNTVFPFIFLVVFLPGPPLLSDPLLAAALGFAVAFVGQLVRGFTIGLKYVVRGGRDRRVYAQDLVTSGLYGHCRNPMYVGNICILVGVAIASNSWSCVALAIPFFTFVYVAIIAAEEQYLQEKFGAGFSAYMHEVPRWLPRLRGLRATFSESEFRWRRVLVKEYGTPFGWIVGIAIIALWNLWRTGQWGGHEVAIRQLYFLILLTTVAWLVIRGLKKTRTIVAD